MKSFKLLLICFIYFGKSYAQQIVVEITKEKKTIITKVEVIGFEEGDSSYVKTLKKNIIESIGDGMDIKKGKYTVLVKFIVSKDGSLSDVICVNDPDFGICEKVVQVVKKSKSLRYRPSEPIQIRELPSMKVQ